MSNINKRLSELSPHVLGIRFTKGIAVIDTFFKEGWTLPKSDTVGYEAVPQRENIYMLWPQNENVGVDEMLDYVSHVIKVNIEREQKIELLQVKINELKHIFTRQPLSKCQTLKFTFEESLIPSTINGTGEEIDLPIMSETTSVDNAHVATGQPEDLTNRRANIVTEDDLDDVPVAEASTDDADIQAFNRQARNGAEVIDLPPTKKGKKKVAPQVQTFDEPDIICKCDPNDPNQACPACIDTKF